MERNSVPSFKDLYVVSTESNHVTSFSKDLL